MRFIILLPLLLLVHAAAAAKDYPTKSGIKTWVDPDTPANRQSYKSSRGRRWELVMSDEFNEPKRDFRPGSDHIWTSLEKPDGVNGARQTYSHNMTSTKCDSDGTCYFYIEVMDEYQELRVYNMYMNPPGFQTVKFFYRAAMVQSWNKFCFQGGMLEVRAQLPGAVSAKSGNPDLAKGPTGRVGERRYYPTWPGIWTLGNLGRAIFSASTNRMWPFSYNDCNATLFDPKNQRISACDANPGYGLNPYQGRGAPEIDLVEGGGDHVSSSLQIAPGMPMNFRLTPVDKTKDDNVNCLYQGTCRTPGANHPGIPTDVFAKRGHKSWYQKLRYSSNPFCAADASKVQSYETVANALKAGVKENTCNVANCPGSKDAYSDLGLIDGVGPSHWGINHNGTCFPYMNAYMGAYICDPDSQDPLCTAPRPDSKPKTNIMKPFNYQMDAISSNWYVHVGAYLDYVVYQIEWVTGENGYVRWMLDGHPIFEVTSESFINVPQDARQTNPRKIMIEEPLYIIFNVALSASWGTTPKFTDDVCRGDGKDPINNKICDEYPMYMKIDHVRLYQDQGDDLEKDNYMQVGCDPASHPTKEWINGHIDEYQDWQNPAIDVAGGAFCRTDDDCTVALSGDIALSKLVTGKCEKKRCKCSRGDSWGGPRCTVAIDESKLTSTDSESITLQGYGPPFEVAVGLAGLVVVLTSASMWIGRKTTLNAHVMLTKRPQQQQQQSQKDSITMSPHDGPQGPAKVDYSRNFV